MMEGIFFKLLNMSISASWLILAVILLRFILKKAPKKLVCLLYILVGIRLACPFSIESLFSLIPSAQTIPEDIIYSRTPEIHTGIAVLNQAVNPVITGSFAPDPAASANPLQIVSAVAWNFWLLGLSAMLIYAAIGYIRIKIQLREAVKSEGNIMTSDNIGSPFILGIIKPRIYLPSSLDRKDFPYVIAHERAHLRRGDHITKLLGFLLLSLHWFNPLVWAAYILMCRDIESACDERVISGMGEGAKKPYSAALLNCSMPRRAVVACPLAFGEVGVKQRIKNVLSYKKPAFWLIILAIAALIVAAVCFLTDPISQKDGGEDDTPFGIPSENSLTLKYLKENNPEYFGLDTFKGLEVYVWQMAEGSYSFGVMEGTNRLKT